MANMKCRMCGGELTYAEGETLTVCGRCGFRQARPKTEEEETLNRFAEAGQLFILGEFAKAAEQYAELEADHPEEAEAIWGQMLCSRGVEYAEAPTGKKRTPFCRELDAKSILEDPDFDRVLELADGDAKIAYQEEASLIEEAFHSPGKNAETEILSKGIHALENRQWNKAEAVFLRVLNENRESSESYLGLMLARNQLTTLNEFLRSVLNRFPAAEATTEEIPVDQARIDEIVAKNVIPGYLTDAELLPLFDYPLTYESRVKACAEAQQRASQAIEEETLLQKAMQYASGAYKKHLEETIQGCRDALLEATAAAEREKNAEAEKLESCYTQHLNEAEKKASELSNAAKARREAEYRALCKRQRQARTREELEALAEAFAAMNGYKQSDNRLQVCRKRIEHPIEKKIRIEKKKLIYVASAAGVVAVLVAAVLIFRPVARYQSAKQLYEAGAYAEALNAFSAQNGYRDSNEWAAKCVEMLNRTQNEEQPPVNEPDNTPEPVHTPEVKPTEKPDVQPTAEPKETPPTDTKYENGSYYLSMPAGWEEKVDILSVGNSLSFYETTNRESAGGLLFTLILMDREELLDCVDWPQTKLLGCLSKNGEDLFLMLRKPSDVQYGEEAAAEAYRAAEDSVDAVVASLKAQDGYVFMPAEQVRMESEQVLRVDCTGSKASVDLLCWTENGWTAAMNASASLGYYGLTEEKMDGDYSTPGGTYRLRFCMALEQPDTKLDFRKIEQGDVWVCDTDSPDYNTLRKSGSGAWNSAEDMYKHFAYGSSEACIYFDFNGDGETAGSAAPKRGSALFIDGVGPNGRMDSGYGDIKMRGEDVLELLRILDSDKNPTVVIRNAP